MYDVCGHTEDETRPSTGLMSRERGASLRLARLVCDRRDVRLRLPACDCIARVRETGQLLSDHDLPTSMVS
jgi:hypothetical protein